MSDLRPDTHAVPSEEYYQKKADGTFRSAASIVFDTTEDCTMLKDLAWAQGYLGMLREPQGEI